MILQKLEGRRQNMSNQNRGPARRMGHGPMQGSGEKAKDFKGTIKKLLKYMRRYYGAIAFVILFAISSTVFNIV